MSRSGWLNQLQKAPIFAGYSPVRIAVILGFATISLAMAAGLAFDAGMLMARQAYLARSLDAAVLAGVTASASATDTSATASANALGVQTLAANGLTLQGDARQCELAGGEAFWESTDYCGELRPGKLPGTRRYYAEARWSTRTYFLQIFGVPEFRLRAYAEAENQSLVDIYTSSVGEWGIPTLMTPSVYGPNVCISRGDAFFAWYGIESEPPGPHSTYTNQYFDETGGAYTYRVVVPQSFDNDYRYLKIEMWDADSANYVSTTQTWFGPDGTTGTVNCGSADIVCLQQTNGYVDNNQNGSREIDEPALYWFANADERTGNGDINYTNPSDHCGGNTEGLRANNNVVWRLFYYRQTGDGSLEPVDLAFYISKSDASGTLNNNGQQVQEIFGDEAGNHWQVPDYNPAWTQAQAVAEAALTDMNWVTPGLQAGSPHLQPVFTDVRNNAIAGGHWTRGDGIAGLIVPAAQRYAEPATLTEDCNVFRSHFYRSFESGGVNSYLGYYTTSPSCSPTTNNDFVVDLDSEVPDIYRDPATGNVELFLQVMGIRGSGENVFDLWAGPSPVEDPAAQAPANGNWRNLHLANSVIASNPQHSSRGVTIYATGHMAVNLLVNDMSQITLAHLGPQFAGQAMSVEAWDSDTNTQPPFTLFFDSIPQTDWRACWGRSYNGIARDYDCEPINPETLAQANVFWRGTALYFGSVNIDGSGTGSNRWASFPFFLPGPGNPDGFEFPFYGARLLASYDGGTADTFTWRVSLDAKPTLIP